MQGLAKGTGMVLHYVSSKYLQANKNVHIGSYPCITNSYDKHISFSSLEYEVGLTEVSD